MEDKIKIINNYVSVRDTHNAACRLSSEIDRFIEREKNKVPWDELKQLADARQMLSKYVWGDTHHRAWDKVEELFK